MALTLADLESEGNACPESYALRNVKLYVSGCEKYWMLTEQGSTLLLRWVPDCNQQILYSLFHVPARGTMLLLECLAPL